MLGFAGRAMLLIEELSAPLMVAFPAVGSSEAQSQGASRQAPIQALYGTGLEPLLMGMRVSERRTGVEPATYRLSGIEGRRRSAPPRSRLQRC